ncbi:MAG: hypothetical protein U0Y96_03705 [Candidatus Kapaibacterium sp.]|nr:hypothetical protein [Bacteroidota bacterium]
MKQRIIQITVVVNAIVLLCVFVVLRTDFFNSNKSEKSFTILSNKNTHDSTTIDTASIKGGTQNQTTTSQRNIPSNRYHQFDTVSHLTLMSSSKTLIIAEPIPKEFQYTLDTLLTHIRNY